MAFDGLVLRAVKRELENEITDRRIEKIFQPEKDEIVLYLRGFKDNKRLFLSADSNYPRINLTSKSFVNPQTPPLFCMLLRKHIGGGKIINIEQPGSERILNISVTSYDELGYPVNKHLIIEIMGKYSNIILTDGDYKVIDAIKRVDFTVSSKRQLLPGLKYENPPAQEKEYFCHYDEDRIREKLYQKGDINADRFLQDSFVGISKLVSSEIAYKSLGISQELLTKDDIDKKAMLYATAKRELEKQMNGENSPNILFDGNTPKYFSVLDITMYGNLYSKRYYDSVSDMIETFYSELHFRRKMKIRSYELQKIVKNAIDKTTKKISIHRDTIINCEKMERYRLYGELLSANIYQLKDNKREIEVLNYYTNENVVIPLKEDLSPSGNIDRYYRLYKKSKTAVEMAEKQLAIAESELNFLEDELSFLENASSQTEIDDLKDELIKEGYINKNNNSKGKKKKTAITMFTDENGYDILVGKNSKQNDEITFKMSKGNDMWLHVKDYHGSHVLIKYKGVDFPDSTIICAAGYAARYSSCNNSKVDVDYTRVKFVKKPAGAKPGGVIYTNYSTITVDKEDKNE